jgi:shikimate kinase
MVAGKLHMRAIDADAEIERAAGRTIPEIFADEGEAGFRRLERKLLLEDLLERPNVVLATGGGAVLHAEVRAVLERRFTVWLTAPLACLAHRVGGQPGDRPSLTGQAPEHELGRVLSQRRALYEQVACMTIDTHAVDLDAAAAAIVAAFRTEPRDGGTKPGETASEPYPTEGSA